MGLVLSALGNNKLVHFLLWRYADSGDDFNGFVLKSVSQIVFMSCEKRLCFCVSELTIQYALLLYELVWSEAER